MPFNNGRNHGKTGHDRSRGMHKESSRNAYVNEHKEMEHEFKHNKETIEKLFNDGYKFETVHRSGNTYTIQFMHPETRTIQEVHFSYEANFTTLEKLWQPPH